MDEMINTYSLLTLDAFARQRLYIVTYYMADDKSDLDDPEFLASLDDSDYEREAMTASSEADAIFKVLCRLCTNCDVTRDPDKVIENMEYIKIIGAKLYKYVDAEGNLSDTEPTEADRWRYIASHYSDFNPEKAAQQAKSIDDFYASVNWGGTRKENKND